MSHCLVFHWSNFNSKLKAALAGEGVAEEGEGVDRGGLAARGLGVGGLAGVVHLAEGVGVEDEAQGAAVEGGVRGRVIAEGVGEGALVAGGEGVEEGGGEVARRGGGGATFPQRYIFTWPHVGVRGLRRVRRGWSG